MPTLPLRRSRLCGRSVPRARLAKLALTLALTLTFAGCGSGEETFTAQDFIDAANGQGAGLVLGKQLISSERDVQIYGVSFQGAGSKTGKPEGEHGAASLTISPDSDGAIRVYQQCEVTGTFLCYRANNASLVFDHGTDPHAIDKVDSAVRGLASN